MKARAKLTVQHISPLAHASPRRALGTTCDHHDSNIRHCGTQLPIYQPATLQPISTNIYKGRSLHIYIYAKISKVIGILYKTKQMLSSKSLLILYDSLIKPYSFSYGITIWGNTFKTYTSKLELLHKKVVRIISFSDYRAHTGPWPVRRGVSGCRSTPPEVAGIDLYCGFRKNGQGGGANRNPKKSRYRL